jgi:hypothetical protein
MMAVEIVNMGLIRGKLREEAANSLHYVILLQVVLSTEKVVACVVDLQKTELLVSCYQILLQLPQLSLCLKIHPLVPVSPMSTFQIPSCLYKLHPKNGLERDSDILQKMTMPGFTK